MDYIVHGVARRTQLSDFHFYWASPRGFIFYHFGSIPTFLKLRHAMNQKLRGFPGGPVVRIHLVTQGMWVWLLVQEDSTHHAATKPASHSY